MRHREFKEVDLHFSACYQKCMFEHCQSGLSLPSSFLYCDALGLITTSSRPSQWDKIKGIDKGIWEGVEGEEKCNI